jgi:spore coat protein A, manganese oxidase
MAVSIGDMSMPDMAVAGAKGDMATGPDMDNHVPLLLVPNAVTADGGAPGEDFYIFHVKQAQQQVLPGNKTTIWGFNGQWPGPTVHATMGRPVTMRVYNDLPVSENITIHNHGHNSLPAFDGHPSNFTIPPTGTNFYDYHYPNLQAGGTAPNYQGAGTYFIHDHLASLTAQHVYKGIAAFYIIHPAAGSDEANLNLPSGQYDIPLMLQDRLFKADNSLDYVVNHIQGFSGNVLVVNATPHPFLSVARRKYRFRILNNSNARRFNFGLSRGQMYQIATDGGLMAQQQNPTRIPLAPAERVEIVIEFAQYKIGDVVTLINDDPFTPPMPEILQFRVTSDATDNSNLPQNLNTQFLPYNAGTPTDTRQRTITIDFDGANSQWRMNQHIFNPTAYEFNSTKVGAGSVITSTGDVETWLLVNTDPQIPHPFHQHLVQFQIIEVCQGSQTGGCGVGPSGAQQGWKDTVLVPAGSTVKIKMKFYYSDPSANLSTSFPSAACIANCAACTASPGNPDCTAGAYVFHCHNLDHEDSAMMLQQVVSHP